MTDEHGHEMTSLDTVTTDELVTELRKRCPSGVCLYAYSDGEGDWFRGKTWGSIFWRHSVAGALERMLRKRCDKLIEADEEDDDDE